MRRSRATFEPSQRSLSRRDLLRMRGVRPTRESSGSAAQKSSAYDLLNASRQAMGSYFEVRLPFHTPGAVELATRALDVVDELEAQMTVYRDDSEIAAINSTAHLGAMPVESGLFKLLSKAIALSRETAGAYDVTSGALSLAWGFVRGPKRVPSEQALTDARARTGYQHVTLDPERRTIAFDRAGIAINLGSIGKGHAIDEAARVVGDYWYPTPALIHGGRSSLYALGSPPDKFGGRWEIGVRNPLDPERPIGTLHLRNRGMGTSGASFQQFEEGGRVYGHLIDPRTGEPPADGPLSVTVLAPTAAEADALSTAFYLLGPEATQSYLKAHPEVGVIFLLKGASSTQPDVLTWGLTDADFRPGRVASEPYFLSE